MKYKKKITVIITILCVIGVGTLGLLLGAGRYAYAQQYYFNISSDNLIAAIKNFKAQNSQYEVPKYYNLIDSKDSTASAYHGYMYIKSESEIIHFVITSDPDNSIKSFVYLDAINIGSQIGHWKVVNRDYKRDENLRIKKMFTTRLLDKLKIPYEDGGNGMFIFWK